MPMKHELFFAILSSLLSPLPGETGSYHKHSWKDNWVNVSRDRIGLYYLTQNRLYLSTNGMVDDTTEKIILRVDRFGVKMDSYQQVFTEYNIDVNCAKKEAIYTHVVNKNSQQEITSKVKIEKTESEKFDDSHLFGAVCAARSLHDVLVNREVKTFDSCDFRHQHNGNNPVKFKNLAYNFPIRWNLETCKAVKNAVWLYGTEQDEAARTRLAWAPQLAILIENFTCASCKSYKLTRFFTN
jgi:hypothetical protein